MDFFLLGGDARQAYLADSLAADGHTVHTYALGRESDEPDLAAAQGADWVLLPLPAVRGEVLNAPLTDRAIPWTEALDALAPGQRVLAGQVSPALAGAAEDRGLTLMDYFAREELAVANAVPTSEGAIRLAMAELPVTLHGARVLIVGYGRIGRVLAGQLRGLGARVTVAARKGADLAWASAGGFGTARSDRLGSCPLESFELVVNTAPAPLLDRAVLSRLKPGGLVIDLAAAPGGTDFTAAGELGIKALFAPGLPGKEAPATAAEAIKTTLYNILTELGA